MDDEIFHECYNCEPGVIKKYKTIRGRTLSKSKSGNLYTKQNTLQNLIDCFNQDIIIIPGFQRELNYEKINKMISTYKEDNETFNFMTNYIQLVEIHNNKYLLIDGQHRFHMYIKLLELGILNNKYEIIVNYIKSSDTDKIYSMYKLLNSDINIKPPSQLPDFETHVTLIFKKIYYTELKDKLNEKYNFKKTSESIYSLDEFIEILYTKEYIELFENVNDAYTYLIDKNNTYCDNLYTENNKNEMKLKKDELTNINNKIIFTLKKNNFIELLTADIDSSSFECTHKWTYNKISMTFSLIITL